jgi:hypothetical protein
MIYIYANNDIQFDGSSINVDVRLKKWKQKQETPKTVVGIIQFKIQTVSVSMLQKIFINTFNKQSNKKQQNIVVPVLPNGHSS